MTESEYIRFWKSVHALANLQAGQSIVLDWLGERRRFVRARDEKGRFTGTQRDTVAGWVRRMEKDRNYKGYLKRVLKEIFILQLLSGRLGSRQNNPYAERTYERKSKGDASYGSAFVNAAEFARSFKVRNGSFAFYQKSVYNLYDSGTSMEEFYKSGTSTITEKGSSVEVRFSITPSFAEVEQWAHSDDIELGVTESNWKLDNQSVLFFITSVLMPYVKQNQGIITDFDIKKKDDFTENEHSPIDWENDEELPF